MKYCPKCRGEYQDWVEKCVDCNEKLVDTLPAQTPELKNEPRIIAKGDRKYKAEPLTAIASYASAMEAQFNKGILESEGIDSIIGNADTVMLQGKNTSTVTGVCLYVKESEAAKAKEILDSIITDISEEDISEADFNEEDSEKEPPATEDG